MARVSFALLLLAPAWLWTVALASAAHNHEHHHEDHHDHEEGEHHDHDHDHEHGDHDDHHTHKEGEHHDHEHDDHDHHREAATHKHDDHSHSHKETVTHKHDDHSHGHGHKETHSHGHSHGHGHKHDHGHHDHKGERGKPNWRAAYASALGMSAVSFIGVLLLALVRLPVLGAVVEYTCLCFAGAVLVADALLHLLPHALEGADHEAAASLGLSAIAGAFSLLVLPELCEWHRHAHGHNIEASGIANLVVEMLHNFVDGIAIGLSFLAGPVAGAEASIAVAAHELPQELGDFMVLRAAGFGVGRLLFWNFVASLTCVLGVAVAQHVGEEASAQLQKHMMSFTAGSFLTLALNMIFPQVMTSIQKHHKTGSSLALAKLLCVLIAMAATVVLLKLGTMEAGHAHHDHAGHSHSSHPHEL